MSAWRVDALSANGQPAEVETAVPSQAAQVFPLFAAAHAVELAVGMVSGGTFPGLSLLLAPVAEAVLWPVASVVLLAPQLRAPNPDANRPL